MVGYARPQSKGSGGHAQASVNLDIHKSDLSLRMDLMHSEHINYWFTNTMIFWRLLKLVPFSWGKFYCDRQACLPNNTVS